MLYFLLNFAHPYHSYQLYYATWPIVAIIDFPITLIWVWIDSFIEQFNLGLYNFLLMFLFYAIFGGIFWCCILNYALKFYRKIRAS
jgi:membrane protease YdiL (CAAX protease family)